MMHHWDPERALELIERERITTFGGVPAMVMQVIDSPDFATPRHLLGALRGLRRGARPARPGAAHQGALPGRRALQRLRADRDVVGHHHEHAATTTSASPTAWARPCPVCDVAVVPDGFDGAEPIGRSARRAPTSSGELWIKGPNVVRGYWNKPEATAAIVHPGLAPLR